MDDCRFDELSRALARGTSRRKVLGGLVGGVVVGFAALRGSGTGVDAARRQPNGAACTSAGQCASFMCVDGVCCNSACTGQCESCASGTCQPISGAPVGNRPACPGSGECAGTCDGVTRNACIFPDGETVCGESTCADGVQTTFACAGNGTCHPTTASCGLFACGAEGTCLTSCVSDDDCVGEAFCANGVCQGDLPAGQPCAGPDQCQSGLCIEGVCCTSACGDCEACNLPGSEGICAPLGDGVACGAGGACCAGSCCAPGQECIDGACQAPACLAPLEECTAADQCCQDEPTGCADVVGCGGGRFQCCGLPGSSCESGCDCCGADRCVEGVCVASCLELGEDCTLDEHCCTGICDEAGRCFDPTLGISCDNPIAEGTCEFPGACQGCEIGGVCFEACGEAPIACVTTTEGANRCIIDVPVAGRGCLQSSSDCGVGLSCVENCAGNRACFETPDDTCLIAPICLAPQEACTSADQCCQDVPTLCEDVPLCGGVGEAQCCRPLGAACTGGFCGCCGSARCVGGVCVEGCIGHGSASECLSDDQCCNGNCVDNVCTCLELGSACNSFLDCCSGNCVEDTCQPCRAGGAACQFDTQCCSQECTDNVCEVAAPN